MRDILDGSSSEQENDEDDSPGQGRDTPSSRVSHDSRGLFLFTPSTTSQSLQSLYPSSSDLLTLFDIFQENVDPVVRIFHCPTLRITIAEALPLLDGSLDRHTEVILFSISYAALTSLSEQDCRRLLGEERRVLLPRYRHAVEQSLARARFLDSQNLGVLASLVLFLICVRRHDSSRLVSSLLGVVIRNAQAMGLHRDGTNFQLSPYETEMRRRIWWHICVLDLRASEDHGCDPSIYEQNYDTKFPLSITDEDISPDDTTPPPERPSGSDMIFCLLRFEVAVAIRKLNYPGPIRSREPEMSLSQKRRMVEDVEKHLNERYIHRCDITKPFDWVAATWARLMLAKMWLAVSNPLKLPDGGDDSDGRAASTPLDLRSLAFEKSLEVLELSDLLETGHRAARWRWLFLTHVQWHAVVFVLAHLCVYPADELAHRAWVIIDRVCDQWPSDNGAKRGMLWKPIRRLMDRAQRIRASAKLRPLGKVKHDYNELPENQASDINSIDWKAVFPDSMGLKTPESGGRTVGAADVAPHSHRKTPIPPSDPTAQPDSLGNHGAIYAAADPIPDTSAEASTGSYLDLQGAFSINPNDLGHPSEIQALDSQWDSILHELHLDFQEGQDTTMIGPGEAMEGYGGNFWNTL